MKGGVTMDKNYVLLKLNTGETIIGAHVPSKSKKHILIENPFIYQIMSITNQFGMKVKDLLSFKRWFEFTDETIIPFSVSSIVSSAPANLIMISFYDKELVHLQELIAKQKLIEQSSTQAEEGFIKEEDSSNPDSEKNMEPPKGIMGSLNLNFNFDDPAHFQMFMDNFQMGMEDLMGEIDDEMDGEDDDEMDDDDEHMDFTPQPPKQPSKRKRAKNRITPKGSFELPYDQNGDPKDPTSWSNDPKDYIE